MCTLAEWTCCERGWACGGGVAALQEVKSPREHNWCHAVVGKGKQTGRCRARGVRPRNHLAIHGCEIVVKLTTQNHDVAWRTFLVPLEKLRQVTHSKRLRQVLLRPGTLCQAQMVAWRVVEMAQWSRLIRRGYQMQRVAGAPFSVETQSHLIGLTTYGNVLRHARRSSVF